MTDHIGEATQKVIDLDALEKRLTADSRQNITRYFGDLSGAIVAHELLRDAAAAVAELREARGLLEEVQPLAICWAAHYASGRGFEQHPQHKALNANIRAFLARNGKGEEQ